LCQLLIYKKYLINQWLEKLPDFRFRAICMNGHHASCILHFALLGLAKAACRYC